ncbi:MAG: AI-2E family transporter [Myxococcota bacterium]
MDRGQTPEEEREFQRRALQAAIRLSLLALLVYLCFLIVQPFLTTVAWGVIIAIATLTPYKALNRLLGGRPKIAGGLMIVLGLLLLILPTVALGASLVETAQNLSDDLEGRTIAVPPPPASIEDWPLIGSKLYALWSAASENLESALERFTPQLKDFGVWLISSMGHLGIGLAMFIIAIVIAGVLLPNADRATKVARNVATMVTGPRGAELVALAASSVRSVTRGILGVALIQALLAGLGMLIAGVPAAGLWTLLVLLVAIVQLPTLIILAPVAVYVFSVSSTATSVMFAIWAVVVGLSDNFLKPLLMGRGTDAPMIVIFVGAIGGFVLEGIIGLFVGAVVLAVGYTLFTAWLKQSEQEEAEAHDGPAADPDAPTELS